MLGRYTTGPGSTFATRRSYHIARTAPLHVTPWFRLSPDRLPTVVKAAPYSYGGAIAAWALLRLRLRDRPWWLTFINNFTPWLFAPVPMLATASLVQRSPRSLVASVAPLMLFTSLYGKRWLPRRRPPPHNPSMRLMTLNMLCQSRPVGPTVAAIRQEAPDVVVLQELTPKTAHALKKALAKAYPHFAVHGARGAGGAAIFSRLPFDSVTGLRLSPRGWLLQDVRLQFAGRPLALINVHLLRPTVAPSFRGRPPFDERSRALETEALLKHTRLPDHDVILAGDFNLTDQSRDYRAFAARFDDAFVKAGRGFGFTYPTRTRYAKFWWERIMPCPLLRLDHVFTRGAITARDARVGPSGDSDHRSLVVDLV